MILFTYDTPRPRPENFPISPDILGDPLELHSAARGLIDDGLTTGLEVVIASEEKKRIAARTYAGLLAKARRGLVPTNIQMYGYHDLPGTGRVVIDPLEAEVVQQMFSLAAEGLSYMAVAEKLNARSERRLRRKAKHWYPGHLSRMLRQSAYKGEYRWPQTSRKGTQPFVISIPAIVDADTWEKAQRRKVGRPPRTDRPLVGHLRCGWCGMSMSSTVNKRAYIYRCNSKTLTGRSCKQPVRYGPTLEGFVEKAVRETLSDREQVRAILAAVPPPNDPNKAARDSLAERDARWLEAFSLGAITAAELSEYRNEIRAELRALATPVTEQSYPLDAYAKAAEELPLRDLLAFAQVTVVVTPQHLEVVLGRG